MTIVSTGTDINLGSAETAYSIDRQVQRRESDGE